MKIKIAYSALLILLIECVSCEVDEIKKAENSSVTQIQYSSNGSFMPQKVNITTHRVSAYDNQMIGQCGGIYRNLQNLIESPKFISRYPICNLRCEYQIVSPYICENEFHVQFLEFSLDESNNCEHDKVIMNYSDVLCGKVMGIKKYRTKGGVLNVTLSSSRWDSNSKGFKLLITRLPCVDDDLNENQTEIDSLEPSVANNNDCFNVNSSYSVANPEYDNRHTIYGVPYGYNTTNVDVNNRQDFPVIPLPDVVTAPPQFPQFPFYPPQQPDIPPSPIFPPNGPRQCCRNVYNQKRFLLISQGFPAHRVLNNDCVFVIHKSAPNVCRLRIHFKYFLLDDNAIQQQQQPGQLGCFNNFIEIDGQRICGCKSNFVYETQWGMEPKLIRLRTTPGSYFNAQGFVMDVEQQDCPFKIQSIGNVRERRHLLLTKKLLLPTLLEKKHFVEQHFTQSNRQNPDYDVDDAFRAKFYQQPNNNNNGFINSFCTLNHMSLLQMKLETVGVLKHFCIPAY